MLAVFFCTILIWSPAFADSAPPSCEDRLRLVTEVKAALREPLGQGRLLTKVLPALIAEAPASVAEDLVTSPSPNREAWLPEALTLFNVPALSDAAYVRMIESVYDVRPASPDAARRLARLSARLGYLGFGFARWRFLFKSFEDVPSLALRFGFRPLDRATDRDLGPGYAWTRPGWSIEFRQAYLLISFESPRGPATLVVRNSSRVYGRDLLLQTAYVAWRTFPEDTLRRLTAESLDRDPRFTPVHRAFVADRGPGWFEKLRRVERVVDEFESFEGQMNAWLRRGPGFTFLLDTLRAVARDYPIYLGATRGLEPSWRPTNVVRVDRATLAFWTAQGHAEDVMRGQPASARLTLLGGPRGDFP